MANLECGLDAVIAVGRQTSSEVPWEIHFFYTLRSSVLVIVGKNDGKIMVSESHKFLRHAGDGDHMTL